MRRGRSATPRPIQLWKDHSGLLRRPLATTCPNSTVIEVASTRSFRSIGGEKRGIARDRISRRHGRYRAASSWRPDRRPAPGRVLKRRGPSRPKRRRQRVPALDTTQHLASGTAEHPLQSLDGPRRRHDVDGRSLPSGLLVAMPPIRLVRRLASGVVPDALCLPAHDGQRLSCGLRARCFPK